MESSLQLYIVCTMFYEFTFLGNPVLWRYFSIKVSSDDNLTPVTSQHYHRILFILPSANDRHSKKLIVASNWCENQN